ncbi:5-formyltetrahydrofolate cyclo-ligase [Aneurinibacillus soli]|uniref:5-formyltetrahydrofolate cyclo-ligase n=1 Tax=Aneurinibacillus soli TaxID=1500254 RepID=A0A0U5BFW4_9BACL|nr:5-formyltetrahydrofolate cyclo-ligase [Aneurinibacillus soli]PYE60592.1 5-formyltetrahydrofolate cyclo-ligase [Aneurinibacillus soli]BAU29884.1 5-formyltetrahydrofolate cyclo-ligase family protein [Aneurinibacillus soli]
MEADKKQEKKRLRHDMLAKRATMEAEERQMKSDAVVRHLLAMPEIQEAERIFTFLSFGDEVNLDTFVDACVESGKQIYIPKTDPTSKQMTLYRFKDWGDLVSGPYGIREPGVTRAGAWCWQGEEFHAIIVPGVAFTPSGLRMGYGGGYYDRFLAALSKKPLLAAVCFDVQMVDSLPFEPHDSRVDRIITEQGVTICSRF